MLKLFLMHLFEFVAKILFISSFNKLNLFRDNLYKQILQDVYIKYNKWETTRVVIGQCLSSIRVQMHEWRHCVANDVTCVWLARVIKVHSVLPAKIFKTWAKSKRKMFSFSRRLQWKASRHRRSQKTSNVIRTSVIHSLNGSWATFLFLPHFDVICDL